LPTTVADEQKFSAVKRLSRRLLDRSKKQFYLTHLHLAPLLEVIQSEFHEVFCVMKLESLGYRAALFA